MGTNNLIKEFASITTEPADVLSFLGVTNKNDIEQNQIRVEDMLPNDLAYIFKHIDKNPIDINEIAIKCNLDLKSVMSKLTMLELDGKIKKIAGNRYVRGDE